VTKVIVADVSNGVIVRTRDKRWGVVCRGRYGTFREGYRIIDFWDGGREYIRDTTVVEIAT
jgi:hypothetical protein